MSVLARGGKSVAELSGAADGLILKAAQEGEGGFGYDPMFVTDGHKESFARLGEEVKNTMSHRSRALDGVRGWLGENG